MSLSFSLDLSQLSMCRCEKKRKSLIFPSYHLTEVKLPNLIPVDRTAPSSCNDNAVKLGHTLGKQDRRLKKHMIGTIRSPDQTAQRAFSKGLQLLTENLQLLTEIQALFKITSMYKKGKTANAAE